MVPPRNTEINQTPNVYKGSVAVRLVGEKVHGQKENSPDRQIRSQNVC